MGTLKSFTYQYQLYSYAIPELLSEKQNKKRIKCNHCPQFYTKCLTKLKIFPLKLVPSRRK